MRPASALVILAALAVPACGGKPAAKDNGPAAADPRPLVVEYPADLRDDAPVPLVVVLHGYGGEARTVVDYLQLGAAAKRHRFVLVAPSGEVDRDGKRFWNATDACCDFSDANPDHVAFLDKLIEAQKAKFPIDPKRVHLIGYSNGAFMAHRYACDRAGKLASIVSIAGAGNQDRARCTPKEPVSLLEIHGDADAVVNFRGGFLGGGLPQRSPYLGTRDTLDVWLRKDACGPVPDTSRPALDLDGASPDVETTQQAWKDCAHGGVELWTMRGVGHRPALVAGFGERVWAFLADHPKR
jgi:polyhydroxybutyrate depolymerase